MTSSPLNLARQKNKWPTSPEDDRLMDIPYTRDELSATELGAKPKRGRFCPKCKSHIPEFADISPDLAAQLKKMHAAQAMATIREVTGCPLVWAKPWVIHKDGPHREYGDNDAPPCPYCGKQLRTKLAKQCVECGADWHVSEYESMNDTMAD